MADHTKLAFAGLLLAILIPTTVPAEAIFLDWVIADTPSAKEFADSAQDYASWCNAHADKCYRLDHDPRPEIANYLGYTPNCDPAITPIGTAITYARCVLGLVNVCDHVVPVCMRWVA